MRFTTCFINLWEPPYCFMACPSIDGCRRRAVDGALNRGWSKNRVAHDLLVELFNLQVQYALMLSFIMFSLKWLPTTDNDIIADSISRSSREAMIRLSREAFRRLWDDLARLY